MAIGLFDVLGPITVGPSSSHTAGAVRIGLVCRMLLGDNVKMAKITFFGSFAETYKGHGTDKAVVGGLLGFDTYNEQVRDSLSIAPMRGMEVSICTSEVQPEHPNTVRIEAFSKTERVDVIGVSIGGGAIRIVSADGHKMSVSCRNDTLVVFNRDTAGVVADVSGLLSRKGYNIATLALSRSRKGENAIMVIEIDQPASDSIIKALQALPNVNKTISIPKL